MTINRITVPFFSLLFLLAFLGCSSKDSFEILYYSNLNGNIEACECYDVMLGGLDQMKPLVDDMRSKNPDLVLIDGGDTFNSYPFIELNQAILDAYKLVIPDIWIPGEYEFIEGKEFFSKVTKSMDTVFLTGNIAIDGFPTQASKKYNFKDKTIMITSYIQPDLILQREPDLDISVKKESLIKNIEANDFTILVFHGDETSLANEQDITSEFDLLLLSHQQDPGIDLNREPMVIGGGADGEFLMHILLQENDSGFKISASKINIEQTDSPNKEIVKIISDYRTKIGLND
jgi:2',3'-cyclic-nucleotide 2'-phosphodiesterase (5'-nucleotidase family)